MAAAPFDKCSEYPGGQAQHHGDADDGSFFLVNLAGERRFRTLDKEHAENDDVNRAHHRAGNGDQNGKELGKRGGYNGHQSQVYPDAPGGDTGEADVNRGYGPRCRDGEGSHQAGKEDTCPGHGQSPLHCAVVKGRRVPVGGPVNHRKVSHRLHEGGQVHEHEHRKQRPEICPKGQVQTRPTEIG